MDGDVTDLTLKALSFDELMFDLTNVEFRQLQLRYRGEGNDNLVLQAPKIRCILRFRKSESVVDEIQENENLKTSFAYYYVFMKPLFSTYCSVPVIVMTSKSEVEKLDNSLFPQRPNHRQQKRLFYTGVEIHPDYAFLPLYRYTEFLKLEKIFGLTKAPSSNRLKHLLSNTYLHYRDFVFSLFTDDTFRTKIIDTINPRVNTVCVEIKPKQAWSAVPDRHSMCVYCMNQFFKLSTNKIKSRSKYCPLDLFSGNRRRMKKAIKALMKDPQNNFRIFYNGKLVYGENNTNNINRILQEWLNCDSERHIDTFCHLIEEALLSKFANDSDTIQLFCKPYVKSRERVLCPNLNMKRLEQSLARESACLRDISLPENSILGRILRLQELDKGGIEIAYDYYETHKAEFTSEFGYVDQLITDSRIIDDRIEVPALNVVEAYLFSTAAKDLSILIAFEPAIDGNGNSKGFFVMDTRNQSYKVNISVVDVGPKPISCIKKHWKRDADILSVCARQLCPESVST